MSLKFGDFELDQGRRQLLRGGEPVPLEPKAYELLSLLVDRRPRALSHAQVRDAVWLDTFVSDTTLRVVVNALREALGDDARSPRFIRTVRGFGYAFCGEVREESPDERTVPASDRSDTSGEPQPYPGLSAFTERDAGLFFGREDETAGLGEKLRRQGLLALIGPSGAGKTSFVRAGVVPKRPEGWAAVVATPGSSPARSLARALAPELASDSEALQALLDFEDPEVAVSLMRRWRLRHAGALVVVDQFEELFTLNPPEVQEAFAALLGRLASEADVCVLLSLRDDFLIRCHAHAALAPVFQDLTPLLPLTGDDLRRALEEPARRHGYRFDDAALASEMVEAAEGARTPLPLLAFAVSRLWERRDRDRKVLTRAAYEEIGGVSGALAQHAEKTLERIGPEREPIVREIFRNLATAQGTRAARTREELLSVFEGSHSGKEAPAGKRTEAEVVLQTLVDSRLLTEYAGSTGTGEGEPHESRVEITHESLLGTWPRLVRWQTQDADGAQLRDQLRQAAHLWEEKGRPADLLWTGTSEREFEVWRARYPGRLSSVEEDFASAMVDRAQRHKRLRRWAVASLVVGLSVVAAVIEFWRQEAETEARQRESTELVALGRLQLEDHPAAALAHALASLEVADSGAARRFALEALAHGSAGSVIPRSTQAVDFSSDGRWLVTSGVSDGTALWSRDGGPAVPLGAPGDRGGQFDPQGPFLRTSNPDTLRVFSVPDPQPILSLARRPGSFVEVRDSRLITITDEARSLAVRARALPEGEERLLGYWPWDPTMQGLDLSSDGSRLVYARDRSLFLLDLDESGGPPFRLGEHSSRVASAAFAPGDEHLVSSDDDGEVRIWSITGAVPTLERRMQTGMNRPRVLIDSTASTLVAGQAGAREDTVVAGVWDLRGPPDAEPFLLRNSQQTWLHNLALDPSGRWLAAANDEIGTLWFLGGRRGRIIRGQKPPHMQVAFTPDGRWLASFSQEGRLRLWPLSPSVAEGPRTLIREGTFLPRMAIGPMGQNVLVVSYSPGRAVLVPIDGGAPLSLERFSADGLESPAISWDGRLAAAGTRLGDADNFIEVWDLRTGEVRTLDPRARAGERECDPDPRMRGAVFDVAFTSDGRLLSTGHSGLRLWDLEDGTNTLLRPCWGSGWWKSLAGSRVDRFLLVEPDNRLKTSVLSFHDLRSGESWDIASHGDAIRSVAIDPKGEIAVTGGYDGVVRVGPVTGEEPHLLYGHDLEVSSVAVSPDGEWIASAGQDGTIRLWPMPEGRPFHTLPHADLLARLRSYTNLRVVRDEGSPNGYSVEPGPLPPSGEIPEW